MTYSILRGAAPTQRFENDLKALREISPTALEYLLPIAIKHFIGSIPITPEIMKELRDNTGLTDEMVVLTFRAAMMFLINSPLISEEEFKNDLERAQLKDQNMKLMIKYSKSHRSAFLKYNQKESSEAIPKLSELNWRVDVRLASSDGFSESFPVALIRVAVSDNLRTERIHFELDKDGLSYLETTLNKIKAAFTKAEASRKQFADQAK